VDRAKGQGTQRAKCKSDDSDPSGRELSPSVAAADRRPQRTRCRPASGWPGCLFVSFIYELFGWVVALRLGDGHKVVKHALVGSGVALEEGTSEVVLTRASSPAMPSTTLIATSIRHWRVPLLDKLEAAARRLRRAVAVGALPAPAWAPSPRA
jgi:hypothetical protein